MSSSLVLLVICLGFAGDALSPGDHTRSVQVGMEERPYLLHVPPSYDARKPTPVVLALHPFATNGPLMAGITGLSATADREGFLVAYPNGTGRGTMLYWKLGKVPGDGDDDVRYIAKVLDDVAAVAKVDPKRVYATGFSNGGMMCYRLASELSGRIAAIAPVAGTMTKIAARPDRPVPVLHFHGTKDTFVTYDGQVWRSPRIARFKGVEETLEYWAKLNGCPPMPVTVEVPREADDGLVIKRLTYGPGREGSEAILYAIEGGGHTWPGRKPFGEFLGVGKSALDLKANDLIWEFFQKHPMP
jgi:polyhydroxybutyrate depolymerase